MPRTPARCTEADINRAAKVAARRNMRVKIRPDGVIVLEPIAPLDAGAAATVAPEPLDNPDGVHL